LHNREGDYADNAILCKNEIYIIKSNDIGHLAPEKGDCADNAPGAGSVCDSKGAGGETFSPDEIEKEIDEYLGVSD
jgi:hypothetical protein